LPFRDVDTHLRDIRENMGFDAYRADLKTKSAVERQLQILTEAAIYCK